MSVHKEIAFEDAIEKSLLDGGWERGRSADYDPELGLCPVDVFTFIGRTQADQWERLVEFDGGRDEAQIRFKKYLAREIDSRGALDVLRHGVKDRGVLLRLAYFRPAHTLADDALDQYNGNILTVTRQLRYSRTTPDKSLDLALFVNGIPVATAELKNPLTGQNVEHAKAQYRRDRDPKELLFARRALVHFAIDPDLVFVTTKLAGEKTRFLPFNTGSEGPGETGGAGNPPAKQGGYRTSYLWEQVWAREAWLDIIRRFLHVVKPTKPETGTRRKSPHELPMIFPRFHQWHAVRRLTEHAETHGAGHNYLVQHSAGSGKSNTLAWLAHRLSNLHSQANEPVFDKVIVITDRTVLDKQLQHTIHQFEHRAGVVTRIGDDPEGKASSVPKSEQVSQALSGETTKILVVTLQTFPFVLDKVSGLRGKKFAVIVDEAHSSQSGESSAALKKVLLKLGSDDIDENGDPLTASALARGRHETLSYFAFTATPKPKTLELFGTPHPVTGNLQPFHVYSMRQAIDEGFILDVLRNYLTYKTYWRLANANPDDREVDERKAGAQLARFAVLSPASLEQRAEIIVEHFHRMVAPRLEGRAKAMVVTRSREHAVKLYRKIKEYVEVRGYTDCGTLVAFSGELEVDKNAEDKVTEAGINGFSERVLTDKFDYTRADDPHAASNPKPEYRILVVADKYQTGFDQPLLTTMYVDKKLQGVAAVQTLSRLNRTHPLKSQDDLLVLDLANEAEEIRIAFKPFFESSITEPTDPNLLYAAQRTVSDFALLVESEMDAFATAYLRAEQAGKTDQQRQRAHADLYRFTDPARDRFVQLAADDPETAEEFRSALRDYVRKYGFLSQVVPYTDAELERLYLYGRYLLSRLPRREDPGVDLGQVDLTHLRITRTGEYDVSLDPEGAQMLPGFTGDGAGGANEPERVSLSELIAGLNEKFGVNLGDDDLVGGSARDAMKDPKVKAAAFANNEEDFGHVFDNVFEDKLIERIENDTKVLQKFTDDEIFKTDMTKIARRYAYEALRRDVA
ncbi:type I restriction endonuclease subunit R [Amycolatopsis dendrobii]|uniref:Type I restriction endonuclease subunit R n=1 Tax=Amycolatopsis dendrobii TaxID=2760662 RepID=A0A7W3ZF25_9PSEU|nr:DEAD/DEAH box helicase family protein [Amycolatopsis dendrobii]MBB1158653.1 type I restriction endonuclease subunit R [Amycolatopsis dendrobii]